MMAAWASSSPSCAPSSADRLKHIGAPDLGQWWPIAAAMLEPAVKRNPSYTIEDIRGSVAGGSRQLWLREPGYDLAVVTEIVAYPAGRRLVLFAAGGALEDGWEKLLASLEQWAKGHGCKGVDVYGRRGWERKLPGYRLQQIVLRKEF